MYSIRRFSIPLFFLLSYIANVQADDQNDVVENATPQLYTPNRILSFNPVGSGLALGRLNGMFTGVETPVVVEIEYRTSNTTLGMEFGFLNQGVDAIEQDWFDGEVFAKADWHIEDYGISLFKRWYQNETLEGWFVGVGGWVEYASVTNYHGDLDNWDKSPGVSYLIHIYSELGYQLTYMDHINLKLALRLGPSALLNENNDSSLSLSEFGFGTSSFYPTLRIGFMW